MDFEGQKKAERTFKVIIVLFAAVGFIWGYLCQQFSQTMYILGAGFLLSCILTLPPWPIYRLKPMQWQKARNFEEVEESEAKTTPSKSKDKKKKK